MATDTTDKTSAEDKTALALANLPAVRADVMDSRGFALLQRIAKAFASSALVPNIYRDNVPNCIIALNLARRLNADELMVMQNLYIVNGNPGWSAKFLIACINTCGRFSSLRYEWRGTPNADEYGCRAWAIEKRTNERLDGVWIDWRLVKAEGWSAKAGSKWKTMPEQMFIYRAASFWERTYAPELSMGLPTTDELGDVIDAREIGAGRFDVDTSGGATQTLKNILGKDDEQAPSSPPATNATQRPPSTGPLDSPPY